MAELVPPSPSSSSSSSSRALVVPEPVKIRPKPKETVLDEDTYIEALSSIIQRDFFPDLPKLEARLEWMKAAEVNDVEKMRELQQRILSTSRPTTVRATPRTAPTPQGFETPSGATPRGGKVASTPAGGATPGGSASSAYAQDEGPLINTNMSLDNFIGKHTSEDDASFGTIMEKQSEKHHEKYDWVENKTQEAAIMLIEATKKDDNGHFPALQTWNYTVRNQLMYVPDGEDSSLMPPPPGPPKAILHQNTRITAQPVSSSTSAAVKKGDAEAVWSMMANDRQLLGMRKAEKEGGKVDLSDLLGTPKTAQSPKVGGYGFVATPSPAPGVDMSPMTTWGRLDGTPLLLDPTDTPLDLTPGPSFKVPEPPRREAIAMRLADKAKDSQRAKARAYAASPYARANSAALSPAGRSLMASKLSEKRGSLGADMQLRASYNSPAVGKGGSSVQRKGGLVTPSPLPSPLPSPSPRSAKAPTPSHASSITDNLLNISSPAPKKGKSITDDLLF